MLFDGSLFPPSESQREAISALNAFEARVQRLSKIFTALSNDARCMVMKQLLEKRNRTINFSDFMRDLDVNPKRVWEHTRKLKGGSLVEKIDRGRDHCSDLEETRFIHLSLALRQIMDAPEASDSLYGGEIQE
jgi:DNA-binding transcriptional ArsR family regulator